MTNIIEFLNAWRELITKVFGEYPLAGALVTILAIGIFFWLQGEWRRGQTKSNLLLVLLGWVILVPIVGFVMTVLSKVWDFLAATLPFVTEIVGSFYRIYQHHPYMVLILMTSGIIVFYAWNRWWPGRPHFMQNRYLRILCLCVGIVIVAHVLSPVVDLFNPTATPTSQPANNDQKKPH